MAASSLPPQVIFSGDVAKLAMWAQRTGLPLPMSADELSFPYQRAHNWLLELKHQLVTAHAWHDAPLAADPRILFAIQTHPHRSSTGLQRSPVMNLTLPRHPTSFFSPDRRVQWEMCFHSAVFPAMRHTVQPIADLLHLLQCLIPGLLVVAKVEHVPGDAVYTTSRGLPPPEWVAAHEARLRDLFGDRHYARLARAAADGRVAFHLESRPYDE